MFKILVVEDDKDLNKSVCSYLNRYGYNAYGALNGSYAFEALYDNKYDLIISDIMMPDTDGIELAKTIRSFDKEIPILFITARDDFSTKRKGFEAGIDDYMIKPFDSKELVARVKAVLRRFTAQPATTPEPKPAGDYIEYPDLIINLTNYSVMYKGNVVDMPPKELELLYFIASSPNQVFTREQLLDHIWGYEYLGDTRTVDVHIKRIREKIHDHEKWSIGTVWGVGYKFETKR